MQQIWSLQASFHHSHCARRQGWGRRRKEQWAGPTPAGSGTSDKAYFDLVGKARPVSGQQTSVGVSC